MSSATVELALDFLDALVENAEPDRRHAINPILVGGGARLAAQALREVLREWQEGAQVIENCLTVARRGDPLDASFPMNSEEARIWHLGRAEAFRHALEMMPPPALKLEQS